MSGVQSFIRFCETEFGTAIMDREATYLKQHVTADDRILNVGCGIGSLEERLLEYEIIGSHRSEEMVQAARDRVSVPVLLGDATELSIATASVDTVVFVSTLEFIPDLDSALAEATRVTDLFTATRERGVAGVPTFAYDGHAARGAAGAARTARRRRVTAAFVRW